MLQWSRRLGQRPKQSRPPSFRPWLECLEDRELLANVFVVTTDADSGANSLRAAILASNATAPVNGVNVIDFNIGSGAQTIALLSLLPTITNSVIIDGTSQAGFSGVPLVTLDGTSAGAGNNGLTMSGGSSAVYDLTLVNFGGSAVVLKTNGNNTIQGCYIGLKTNDVLLGNTLDGILIDGNAHNLIGGTSVDQRNVISGNGAGIEIVNDSGLNASFNLVEGNYIGTDPTGALARGNSQGILIHGGATFNTIGGTTTAAANLISANQVGVAIEDPGTIGNVVEGNSIGSDASGANWLGNAADGILIQSAQDNIIGGLAPGTGNVVSGNLTNIHLQDLAVANVVAGNSIGTNAAGTALLAGQSPGLTSTGVLIDSSADNTIGSVAAGAGNLISGNGTRGIIVTGSSSDANVIKSNLFGTDKNGATVASLVNGFQNIYVTNAASNTTVGGLATGAGNIIANSGGNGILIGIDGTHPFLPGGDTAPTTGTTVLSNSIFGNATAGIAGTAVAQPAPTLTEAELVNGTTLIVGGTLAGTTPNATVIIQFFDSPAGSSASGKVLLGSETVTTDGSGNAVIDFSVIASVSLGDVITAIATTSTNGSSPFSSGFAVTSSSGSPLTLIVSSTADTGLGTLRQAILDSNAAPTSDGLTNRLIFNLAAGAQTISLSTPLPTITAPLLIDGTSQNGFAGTPLIAIDGSAAGAGANGLTITAGNSSVLDLSVLNFAGNGIVLSGAGNNTIQGNLIGVDSASNLHGNSVDGILIDGSSHNLIGGTLATARNVISGNANAGVEVADATGTNATFNVIAGNYLGTDRTGASSRGNSIGVLIDSSAMFNTIGSTAASLRNVISANQQGVVVQDGGTSENALEGNFIGTDATGVNWLANALDGVLFQGVANNLIGGLVAGAGNVISGNPTDVHLVANANLNVVAGNTIGANAAGTAPPVGIPAGFTTNGVVIDSSIANLIGGIAASAGNLISGLLHGVIVTGNTADSNAIEGNRIGTDTNGNQISGLKNGEGVYVTNGATNTTVGDLIPGAGNVIAASTTAGVRIGNDTANPVQPPTADTPAGTGNAVRGNSIFGNTLGGIVLGPNGNPNLNQIAPTLNLAQLTNGNLLTAQGKLSGTVANTIYTIQFFANAAGTTNEGQTFLGSESVLTDGSGNVNIAFALATASVPVGNVITAMATDSSNNSSPFSNAASVVGNFSLDVDGNGSVTPLTDGILILRFLFGFSGTTLTSGALAPGATRTDSNAIIAYLNAVKSTMLDPDGTGTQTALTDGILILRYMFNFTGNALTSGAVGPGATRTDPNVIKAYLDAFNPAVEPLTVESLHAFAMTDLARLDSLSLDAIQRGKTSTLTSAT